MTEAIAPPIEFKDRSTGLTIFGIVVILLGCMSAFVSFVIIATPFLPQGLGTQHEMPPFRLLLPGILMYFGVAIAFIWLGIGSLLGRRWARTLLLVTGWLWLAAGIMSMINTAFMFPAMLGAMPGADQIQPVMKQVILVVAAAFQSIFYVIIPGSIVLFYKSPHVKATCESRDPVIRWTDLRPLPVLILCVVTAASALSVPAMVLSYNGVVPFFGTYLSGLPGAAVSLIMALIYAFAARACYKLEIRGWWIALLAYGLSSASCVITFALIGIIPMYEQMGFPESQLTIMKHMTAIQGPMFWILSLMCSLPFFGFLAFAKRYFKK
jgi:hypothetical protein